MNATRERELKLDAPSDFSLARTQPRLDAYGVSSVKMQRLHTVYYDTADLRLARWGCSLRLRQGEGWTLKIPVPHELSGLVREEHHFPRDGAEVPAGVLELGTAYFRGDIPVPVAELRTLRVSRQIVADDGSDVACITEDDVHVIEGTHVANRFREVEIELTETAPDSVLDELGRQFRRLGAGKIDPTPKNVRAAGARSCEPELAAPPRNAQTGVDDMVRAVFAESVAHIIRLDVQLRVHPNEEIVHHARVAVRRLRSHLRAFLPVLDLQLARALRERLWWLQDGLADARDLDVFLRGMNYLGESLPHVDRSALEHVLQPFREARARAYQRVAAMLREERYVSLLRDIVDAAKRPPLKASATGAACDLAPVLISDAWSTVRKRVRRRAEPPSDRELHRIRTAAKRVRYLAEAIAPVAGSAAARLAESAERLQTVLGEQHDAVVARERLRTMATDGSRAFVAGELAAGANAAALDARRGWEKAWRAVKRCRRAFKTAPRS